MRKAMKCLFFRKTGSQNIGKGTDYCDIDGSVAICEGEVRFCEKPEALRKYFRNKLEGFQEKERKEGRR